MISFIDFNLFARIIASIIAIIVAYYIGKIAESQVKKARIEAPPEIIYNIARSLKMIAIIIGILVALSILEIDLTGLLIAAGFAGIVVGLAAQQTLSQLFAGIALIIEGRLKIGDSV
ncbi:MAG: mechanosensitive ion channel, partial [Desulfurococcaceae archaeon]